MADQEKMTIDQHLELDSLCEAAGIHWMRGEEAEARSKLCAWRDRHITAYTASLTAERDELRELVVKGYDVVQDFMPNIGRCALQNYQALNEFTIEGGKIKAALKGGV